MCADVIVPAVAARELLPSTWTTRELIQYSKENPPEAILDGLLYCGDTLLIHGTEESFKSMLVVQMANSIALGQSLLRQWRVRHPRRVGVIETEMHPNALGKRLAAIFLGADVPENAPLFWGEEPLREWRKADLDGKFDLIEQWVNEKGIEVLMIDTANDFFRGEDNPSDERSVGKFFDRLRGLDLKARILVRHNRKKKEIDGEGHSNEMIRGSAEWKEDPEGILHLDRIDKRTNEVSIEVGKLRYGKKPEPFRAWFDVGSFYLTPLPPVISILQTGRKRRQDIVDECKKRFGVETRLCDAMLDAERPFLRVERDGHNATFEIDPDRSPEATWATFLTFPDK